MELVLAFSKTSHPGPEQKVAPSLKTPHVGIQCDLVSCKQALAPRRSWRWRGERVARRCCEAVGDVNCWIILVVDLRIVDEELHVDTVEVDLTEVVAFAIAQNSAGCMHVRPIAH